MRAGLIVLLALLAGCAGSRVERDVVFTPPGWPQPLAADLYLPEQAGPRPAVVVVHGGGWASRSRGDTAGIAKRLAARGFVAMNVSYRLAPAYRYPAQLEDLQQAVRWLRAAGARYDVAPERIGAFGYSAGGHLVALLGATGAGETRLQAVVAGGAPTDLRKFTGGKLVPQFLGATQAEKPELFAAASPIVHVGAGDPPMFLYHGGGDALVPVDHAEDMKRALDRAGVRAELRVVPLLGHIPTFFLARGTENEAMSFLQSVLFPQ